MLRGIPIRWRVLAVLFLVSFVNYALRNVISVAAPSLREEFGFTSAELGWILPETDTAGGLDAVERWRAALADIGGVVLTAGVCDLAGGGDALGTYALADRALTTARRRGAGSTEAHLAAALPVLPPRG